MGESAPVDGWQDVLIDVEEQCRRAFVSPDFWMPLEDLLEVVFFLNWGPQCGCHTENFWRLSVQLDVTFPHVGDPRILLEAVGFPSCNVFF